MRFTSIYPQNGMLHNALNERAFLDIGTHPESRDRRVPIADVGQAAELGTADGARHAAAADECDALETAVPERELRPTQRVVARVAGRAAVIGVENDD